MRVLLSCSLMLSLLATTATGQAPAVAPDMYRDEPLVFEQLDTAIAMRADGTGDTTLHILVRVQSEGTARQFSVLSGTYASASETGSFDYVRVHKADGSTVETPVDGSMEMPAAVTRDAPVYSDIREKHLPVRSLAVGDRLEYQFHTRRTQAEAPNQFWGAQHFVVAGGVVLHQTVTLSVPAATYVQVWSPNHPATPTLRDGNRVWQWTSSQTRPSTRDSNGQMTAADAKDPDEDSDGRKLPSVAWTTFHSWAEVGDWYRSLQQPRAEPTAAIRAKADELTKAAATPEAQVRALYRYVSTQTRYVGISLGVGRYQPHAATDVLANQYGDCKDKDTLLESLLRAKGFATAPALIGAGIAPVPALPSPAVFNHLITTVELPGGRIWLDSTPEVAPYRVLSPVLRDEEALVMPAGSPAALVKTPLSPPFPYLVTATFEGSLDREGHLKGHQTILYRSDAEFTWRAVARRASPAQWDEMLGYMAPGMGYTGRASNTDLRQTDEDGPFRVSFDYSADNFYDWKRNNIIGLFPLLDLATIDKDKAPEHDIDMGPVRTLVGRSSMTLPPGYRAELPSPLHVEQPFARYDETWKLADGTLVVDRKVEVLQTRLPKERWKDYLEFCKKTTDNGELYIAVIPPAAAESMKDMAKAPATGSAAMAEGGGAPELIQQAAEAERHNDWAGAKTLLQQAKDKDAHAPYLMSMLGFIAMHDRKPDEAIADYKDELAAHPSADSSVIAQLAAILATKDRMAEAVALLQGYSSRQDLLLEGGLVNLQSRMGDKTAALATAKATLDRHPDNTGVQQQVSSLQYDLHLFDDAAATAKKAMQGSDDPYLINNEVYLLAEMKRDLPFAEENSRRAIKLVEDRIASLSVEQANSRAFADAANLAASWDTLGYILLLQGKAAAAEPYFYAAWFNRQDVAVGNHLGQVYEALGRTADALRMYQLAVQTEGAANSTEDHAAATAAAARLAKAGVKPAAQPAGLQELRTFHLPKAGGAQGGGTVRVQLGAAGVTGAMLVTGDAALKALLPTVRQMRFKGAIPVGSQAQMLRDAVVYCGKTAAQCDFVFMTSSGIGSEGAAE